MGIYKMTTLFDRCVAALKTDPLLKLGIDEHLKSRVVNIVFAELAKPDEATITKAIDAWCPDLSWRQSQPLQKQQLIQDMHDVFGATFAISKSQRE
jgi:hypothetical protein